jgi:hypothetical protein
MNNTLQKYNRTAICCFLNEFDPIFATSTDAIEVCEWKNGEGIDININDTHYALTYGELKAINYLVSQLKKD